jgi:hypothetical protein
MKLIARLIVLPLLLFVGVATYFAPNGNTTEVWWLRAGILLFCAPLFTLLVGLATALFCAMFFRQSFDFVMFVFGIVGYVWVGAKVWYYFRQRGVIDGPVYVPEPKQPSTIQQLDVSENEREKIRRRFAELGGRFANFAGDGSPWVHFLPAEARINDARAILVSDMLAIIHSLDITGLRDSEGHLWRALDALISRIPPCDSASGNYDKNVIGRIVKIGEVWRPHSLIAVAKCDVESRTSRAGNLAALFRDFVIGVSDQLLELKKTELISELRRGEWDSGETDSVARNANRKDEFMTFMTYFQGNHERRLAAYVTVLDRYMRLQTNEEPKASLAPGVVEEDCRLLGIDEYYTRDELSAARRAKAAQWHPDKLEHMAPELRDYASRQLTRFNLAHERLEKLVTWDAQPETLLAECEAAAGNMESLNREWAKWADSATSGDSQARSRVETFIDRYDDGIRKMRACLTRVRKEAPTMNVSLIEQTISKSVNTCRNLKTSAARAAAAEIR